MEEANLVTRSSPLEHAKVLAVLLTLYGGFHLLGLGSLLALSLGTLLSIGGRAWENDLVSDGVTGGLSAFPFLVLLPFVAAYSLSSKRRLAKVFLAMSATVTLLLSLFTVYINFDDGEFGWAIYYVPCLGMSIYSFWFVRHKPTV